VSELVNDIENDDSLDKLREYKDSLEKVVSSDAEGKLQNFYEDLMKAQNGHLEIYARQTQQAEEDLKESLGKPPIPCHIFNQEMQLALSNRNNVGVYHTGKKVVERLIRQYVKPKQDAFT